MVGEHLRNAPARLVAGVDSHSFGACPSVASEKSSATGMAILVLDFGDSPAFLPPLIRKPAQHLQLLEIRSHEEHSQRSAFERPDIGVDCSDFLSSGEPRSGGWGAAAC